MNSSITPFKIPDFNIEEFNGYLVREVQVEGFWSTPITIRIQMHGSNAENATISRKITHSCGGYETEEDHNAQLSAERNFAIATLGAIEWAQELNDDQLIHFGLRNQAIERERRQKAEQERELAKKEAWENDQGFTTTEAQELVGNLKLELEQGGVYRKAVAIPLRGEENKYFLNIEAINFGMKNGFRLNNKRIAAAALVAKIAQLGSKSWWLENMVTEAEHEFGRREAMEEVGL